jgi:hypothetical protein
MSELDEPSSTREGACCGRLRSPAGKLLAIVGALVAGALFWATYRRFVPPGRRNDGSGDWPHSACSE